MFALNSKAPILFPLVFLWREAPNQAGGGGGGASAYMLLLHPLTQPLYRLCCCCRHHFIVFHQCSCQLWTLHGVANGGLKHLAGWKSGNLFQMFWFLSLWELSGGGGGGETSDTSRVPHSWVPHETRYTTLQKIAYAVSAASSWRWQEGGIHLGVYWVFVNCSGLTPNHRSQMVSLWVSN